MAVLRIDRLTRVKMLLTSYLDARPGTFSTSGDRISKSRGSTTPQTGDLWKRGSYQELEDALWEIGPASRVRLYSAFIVQPDRRRRASQLVYRQKQAKNLAKALEELSRAMPRRIHVPKDVIENWQDGLNAQFHRPSKTSDSPVDSA